MKLINKRLSKILKIIVHKKKVQKNLKLLLKYMNFMTKININLRI